MNKKSFSKVLYILIANILCINSCSTNNGFLGGGKGNDITNTPTNAKLGFSLNSYYINSNEEIKLEVVSSITDKDYFNNLSFTSLNPDIVLVVSNNGLVKGLKSGKGKVKVKDKYGLEAYCDIYVDYKDLVDFRFKEEIIELDLKDKTETEVEIITDPILAKTNFKYIIENDDYVSINNKHIINSKKRGKTTLTVFNDINNNSIIDDNDISHSVVVQVHDYYSNSRRIEPTCTSDGLIINECSCGCGKNKNVVIPALKHTFVSSKIIREPTCTIDGIEEFVCSKCGYIHEEPIPAHGHELEELHNDDYIASLGDSVNKTKYYYHCSICGSQSNLTYEYGNTNYLYEKGLSSYIRSGSEEIQKGYLELYNCNKEFLDFDKNLNINQYSDANEIRAWISTDFSKISQNEIKAHERYIIGEMLGHLIISQMPELYWLQYDFVEAFSVDSSSTEVVFKTFNDYASSNSRKEGYQELLDVYSEVDNLIRPSASDIEKAFIIYSYIGSKLKYLTEQTDLVKALLTSDGNCQAFSKLFVLLAHRYNLGAALATSSTHMWNVVSIDDKWYYVEPQGSISPTLTTNYFCLALTQDRYHDDLKRLINNNDIGTTDLSRQLISLYKNDDFVGVYTSFDQIIDELKDSNGNYKIELGVSSIGGYICQPIALSSYNLTKTNCSFKNLTICRNKNISNKDAVGNITISCPKEFAKLNNIVLEDNIYFSTK